MTPFASRQRIAKDALELDEVQQKLAETPARRKILLIDACRTAPRTASGGTREGEELEQFAEFRAAEGERILVAAPFGQPSREYAELQHGAFTYFVLQALEPKPFLTFRQLADTVSRMTRDWTQ